MTRSLGVEEELLLVDPDSGRSSPVAEAALREHHSDGGEQERRAEPDRDAEVESELFRYQVETATVPCTGLADLAAQLGSGRRTVSRVAERVGVAAVAVPTPVLADEGDQVTRTPRYERIRQQFGELARTSLACAMHVHVEVSGDEEGVRVLDAIRPWLPPLIALSANSPYARGRDTGYASWRTQIWRSWPSNGTGEAFARPAEYDRVRRTLVSWGAALDEGMVYFDARLSASYPTLEVRVADVCTDLDDALLIAALVRGLVTTAADDLAIDRRWRSDLLRAASWRASRDGIADRLVHPTRLELAPAREVLEALVTQVRPALADAGDSETVDGLLEQLLARGGGATRQRRVLESRGSLEAVVADLVQRTAG